jgi:hypothetical protein
MDRSGHTPTPLYQLNFPDEGETREFVEIIRQAMKSRRLRRLTPPGPLVVYAPPVADETMLFVTGGILRGAEILGVVFPAPVLIPEGASTLPSLRTLFAQMGGSTEEPQQ